MVIEPVVVDPPATCGSGMSGTPPNCYPIYVPPIYVPPVVNPPPSCPNGQTGTPPRCYPIVDPEPVEDPQSNTEVAADVISSCTAAHGAPGSGRIWAMTDTSDTGSCIRITDTALSDDCTTDADGDCLPPTGNGSCLNPDDPNGPLIAAGTGGGCPRVYCDGSDMHRTGYDSEGRPIMEGEGRYVTDGCGGTGTLPGSLNAPIETVPEGEITEDEPPPAPSAPTLTTPSVTLDCLAVGWEATWDIWSSPSTREYQASWEAQWRTDPGDPWQTVSVTESGGQLTVSGGPEPNETVETQVRGQGRQRTLSAGVWTAWSNWSSWTTWRTETDSCPAPPLPVPIVTACRSAAGVEVEWALPSGAWAPGTGWIMDVNERTQYGQISTFLSAFSADNHNPIPWADRSVTLAIPDRTGIIITLLAYNAGPPGRYGTQVQETAEAQPEPGCGAPAVPAAPSPLADPAPTLACGPARFFGGFDSWADSAAANWEREAEYEAEYEDINGVWQPLTIRSPNSGRLAFDGPANPGGDVDVRVRGRGRHRQQVSGTWTPWSIWGAWSSWHAHTTPTCVAVPAPPTASSPTGLAVDCAVSGSAFAANATWTAPADTATLQYRHTVTWTVETGGVDTLYTTGPHTATSATITTVTHSLAGGDQVRIHVATQARARALISASSYTAWSAWGPLSPQAGPANASGSCPAPSVTPIVTLPCSHDPSLQAAVYPAGHPEPYTDTNGNGSWDTGERYTDLNDDGTWTADLGGELTGLCYPPGHICVQPDQLCIAKGS